MPKLNLKDDELEGEPDPLDPDRTISPPPTLREVGGGEHHSSPLLMIVVIVVVIAAGAFALNFFHVIHIWGKRAPKVAEVMPEPSALPPPPAQAGDQSAPSAAEAEAAATPVPEPGSEPPPSSRTKAAATPKVSIPASGSGVYTVQVSSWIDRGQAEEQAARLTTAGYSAFVEDASVGSETWHRVRVGRFDTQQEAEQAAAQLQTVVEDLVWVTKVGSR